uniref:Glucosylceramidase n=1 Tax=Timema bartmani TaxID=61472 RepID=A0A7R9ERZ5_9NEOP|nr:unnamed protein product [Timema bartmani]
MELIKRRRKGAQNSLARECAVRDYGASSIVCVCNSTYCDSLEPIEENNISGGHYLHYVSSKAGRRLEMNAGTFKTEMNETVPTFTVDKETKYQEIFGFGAALTDSTALNIKNLSDTTTEVLLNTYFGKGGSNYLYLRVPMGACDFSTRYYSYDDVEGDTEWEHFDLIDNDYQFKVPIIKRASELRGETIKLFATPWSAPWWMKINGTTKGIAHLDEQYYQPWANYFLKYFDAFARQNISFWGVNPQNEPSQGYNYASTIPVMGWSPEAYTGWVADYLGPTLEKGGYGSLKLMILDDNRMWLPNWVNTAFNNWVVGWTDWNMALNEDGGPATFNDNPTVWGYNAAIIVNATGDEFYKQPPYYFQAHYSMFVPPGSVHIQLTYPNPGGLLHVAFLTPENNVVVILYNRDYGSTSIVCVCNATYCDILDPISEESITSGSFIHYSSTQSGKRLQPNKGVFSNNEGGAQLLFLRIPMGASDFSLRPYTYDDIEGDVTLEHFALIDNDYDYKIPILNRATEIRGQELKLFTSPWSAPWWMKINGTTGISHLAEEYYQVWADYFVKYFDAYAQQGISFWGYSPQNEPIQGSDHAAKIISMGWTKESQTPWIADYLGPTMEKGGYGDLKMMILDDNRSRLPGWAETVFANAVAKSYVAGTAVHWYTDEGIRPNAFNNWVVGWTDWNMAINEQGGPATFGYNAAIIVNATADEFYKQPPYYFQAHFSMFIPPDSKHVSLTSDNDGGLLNVAFITPETDVVVILMNS